MTLSIIKVLADDFETSILEAPPFALVAAAERVADAKGSTGYAQFELHIANRRRVKAGKRAAWPAEGTKLYSAFQPNVRKHQ